MSKRKGNRHKQQKPLLRQCTWCKQVLVKSGDYLTEGKEAFCSTTCLNEWKTRESVVRRELEGQERSVLEKRLKAHGLVNNPISPVEGQLPNAPSSTKITPLPELSKSEMLRGLTVSEFLEGRSDAEIEQLAEQLRNKTTAGPKRKHAIPYPFLVTLLFVLFLIGLGATYHQKKRFYAIALENKHKIESLKKRLESVVSSTVPIDTTALKLFTPSDNATQYTHTLNVSGAAKAPMSLTLIVNGTIRAQRNSKGGDFTFYNINLGTGLNGIVLKGVDAGNKIYTKRIQVFVDEKVQSIRKKIDYDKNQPFVVNQYPANLNYTRGNPNIKEIALTFDGSSHSGEAMQILDTLKSRSVKATFFLTGKFVENNQNLVRRMAEEQHVLANHTLDHPHLTSYESTGLQNTLSSVSREFVQSQIKSCEAVFDKLGLPHAKIWRAPYGEQNRTINSWGEEIGFKQIGWTQGNSWRTNLDTNDWVTRPDEAGFFYPDEVITKITSFGKGTPQGLNGGILLMHIGTLRKDNFFYTRLGVLIDSLRQSGYQFITIPDMLNQDQK